MGDDSPNLLQGLFPEEQFNHILNQGNLLLIIYFNVHGSTILFQLLLSYVAISIDKIPKKDRPCAETHTLSLC